MAWPDSPPPEQLDVYNGGLSGSTNWAPDHSGSIHKEPSEYVEPDGNDGYQLKSGWYSSAELAAYLADPPDDGGGDDVTGSAEAQAVAAFLGAADDQVLIDLAEQHVSVVTAMVRAYTRDEGFNGTTPNNEVAAVITTATARLVSNPEQLPYDSGSTSIRGGFNGFSLAETIVLNRYRKRAA